MADDAAAAPETEQVETGVLYIRDRVLEWQGGLIQFRHIQTVSCENCDPPPRPDGAEKNLRIWKKLRIFGVLLLFAAFAALLVSFGLSTRKEQGGINISAELFLPSLGAGAYLLYRSRTQCAKAKAEIEKWTADCGEAEQRRRMVVHLSSGRTVSIHMHSADLMGRVLQALSLKLQHPEDPGGQYKIELDTGKFYRMRPGRREHGERREYREHG